jgi:hypothetical protein
MKFHRTQFLPESSSLIGEDHVNIPVSVSEFSEELLSAKSDELWLCCFKLGRGSCVGKAANGEI